MPRQRRQRAKHEPNSSYDETPSYSEWLKMEPHDQLAVCTEDLEEFPFLVGDTVALLSSSGDTDEWYGIIEGIRQRDLEDPNDVWVRVQWFYSPEETEALLHRVKGQSRRKSVKGKGKEKEHIFDPNSCSPTERILSDHYDIITTFALEKVVTIPFFDESDFQNQQDIPLGQLFYRYTLAVGTADLKTSPPCLCSRAFSLSRKDPDQGMRLCAECKWAWHYRCLLNGGFVDEHAAGNHLSRLLGQAEGDNVQETGQRSTKKRKLYSEPSRSNDSSTRFLLILTQIPSSLLLLAAQPLVRGSMSSIPLPVPLPNLLLNAPSERSKLSNGNKRVSSGALPITGNVCAVLNARTKLRKLACLLESNHDSGISSEMENDSEVQQGYVPLSDDPDVDEEIDLDTNDFSREEEAQVIRELEVELSDDGDAPESDESLRPLSSTLFPSSHHQYSGTSNVRKPNPSRQVTPPNRVDLAKWEAEPGWERYVVAPIWIPSPVSEQSVEEEISDKLSPTLEKKATRTTRSSIKTVPVVTRSHGSLRTTRATASRGTDDGDQRSGSRSSISPSRASTVKESAKGRTRSGKGFTLADGTNLTSKGKETTRESTGAVRGPEMHKGKVDRNVEFVAYPFSPTSLEGKIQKQAQAATQFFRCPGCGNLI
ncbi:hypothetical protein K435DRAFT_318331 [Dendrothele bispora CBS 962.96]|uniref:BAH domain-containing protein n=1 Tax=Dendrothele bispora (strain CBS 962.96) TaxID=1314807 RepID=A0A4S8LGH0_DENBC|nr:hypothetical protein K435DRAFT_318331 [Dendrothele bispora CBS 962.96]